MVKENIFEKLGLRHGTNSMTPEQVSELGTILPNQDSISVLEFGAGPTTTLLHEALKTKYSKVKYVTYETNKFYAPKNPEIDVVMHTVEELINGKITLDEKEKYDLIIVDGPDGELRKYWYPLFKNNVKNGTVVHIDDAFHYPSFESEFKKYFTNTKYLFEHGRGLGVNKCWITAKIII